MEQEKLIELLLQQNAEISNRTSFCPDEYVFAAYFSDNSDHSVSELHENHLVECGYCLARVAVLAQVQPFSLKNDVHHSA